MITAIQVTSIFISQTGFEIWNLSQPNPSYVLGFYCTLILIGAFFFSLLGFEAVFRGNEYKYVGFMVLSNLVV